MILSCRHILFPKKSFTDKLVKLDVLVKVYAKSSIESTPEMCEVSRSKLKAFTCLGIIGFKTI